MTSTVTPIGTSAAPFSVELDALTVRFGTTTAVDAVTTGIAGGRITGLLGRNGAGKSTMMSTIAGYFRPTSGGIRVDRCDPYEHARVMAETCLVRDSTACATSTTVKDAIEIAAALRPRWDAAYADRLLERFEIPRSSKIGKLSRGKQSAVAVTLGLAGRARLTMFDEPHLGMDAPSRYAFYEEIIADYVAHPRTILLSSHLIDEIANVIEDVVVIDRGRLLFNEPIDDLRARGAEITGPADAVDDATVGMQVLSERTLGRTKSVVVFHPLDDRLRVRAAALGIDVGPLPLQDLFVHLTDPLAGAGAANASTDHSATVTLENRP
jgi:ABC-2 type transport system ATP-binding protein